MRKAPPGGVEAAFSLSADRESATGPDAAAIARSGPPDTAAHPSDTSNPTDSAPVDANRLVSHLDETLIAAEIVRDKVDVLAHAARASMTANLVVSLCAVVFLWNGSLSNTVVALWFGVNLLILAVRWVKLRNPPSTEDQDEYGAEVLERRQRWLRRCAAGAGASGFWWALMTCCLFLGVSSNEFVMISVVSAAMCAGAAASFAVHLPAVVAFAGPCLSVLAVFFVSRFTLQDAVMGVMVFAYGGVLYRVANSVALSRLNLVRAHAETRAASRDLEIISGHSWAMENWVGADGRLRWASPSSERLTGYTPEELIAMDDFPAPIVHEGDRAHIMQAFAQAQKSESRGDAEFRLRRKDGEVIWCSVVSTPAIDSDGRRAGFRSSVRDISENRALREEIEETNRRLGIITNYSQSWELWSASDGTPLWISPSVEQVTGYTAEECWNMPGYPLPIIHEDDREDIRAQRAGQERLEDRTQLEFRIRTKSGEVKWCIAETQPAYDDNGDHAGVRATITDVSRLKALQEEVEESNRRLGIITEYCQSWEVWVSPESELLWLSPSVKTITGYTAEECMAMSDYPLPLIHADDREDVLAHLTREDRFTTRRRKDFRIRRKDGGIRWCIVDTQPAYDHEGKLAGVRATITDISDQKELQAEFAEANTRLNIITEYSRAWEEWVSLDGDVLWISPSVKTITGYSVDECQKMPDYPYPLIHEDDREALRRRLTREDRFTSETRFEFRIRRKDGEVRWCMVDAQPAYDESKQLVGLRASITDITDYKALQGELKETAENLAIIADYSYAWEIWWSPEGEVLWVNRAVEKVSGYTVEEFLALDDPMSVIIEEDRDAANRRRKNRDKDASLREYQCRIRRKDGEIRWVHVQAEPAYDNIGEPVGFRSSVRDITELKDLEAELQRQADELRIITDFSQAWELWFDSDVTPRWISPSVEQMIGYTPEECHAMERFPLPIVHDEDRDRMARGLTAAVHKETVKEIEFRAVRKDGAVIWCGVESRPAFDAAGNAVGFRSSVRDITRQKALQTELERIATTDSLTGIHNRRHFFSLGETEVYRAARYRSELAIAMIDIDHFKKINDTHGHHVGDECLKALAECVTSSIRRSDLFARLGGEEFAIMMPETSLEASAALMDRLREKIAAIRVPLAEGECQFTASIGVAAHGPEIPNLSHLLQVADDALYESKNAGRDRVTVALAEGGTTSVAELVAA